MYVFLYSDDTLAFHVYRGSGNTGSTHIQCNVDYEIKLQAFIFKTTKT